MNLICRKVFYTIFGPFLYYRNFIIIIIKIIGLKMKKFIHLKFDIFSNKYDVFFHSKTYFPFMKSED